MSAVYILLTSAPLPFISPLKEWGGLEEKSIFPVFKASKQILLIISLDKFF